MPPIIEDEYDFLVNKAGEIMLVMNSREKEPEKPRMIYDGAEMAILYRSKGEALRLSSLPPNIVERLGQTKEILVCEMTEEGDFGFTYKTPVKTSQLTPG